jgi:hypothetical protein
MDKKPRVRLTLKVTPESIEEASKFDPNISSAFERKFAPKNTEE